MCGICGIARTDGVPVDHGTIETMASSLQHRGPDAQGVWRSDDGLVGFGHRRLAIIDLSPAGNQPMKDNSGRICITFNGEIYNYQELRAELVDLGHTFRTATDTEVILEAYREWGTAAAQHLNGMFAFALHDAERRRVWIVRDRAGEKPLYFTHQNGQLAFASELKALMRIPEFRPRIDPAALNEFLTFGYVPGASCILRGVCKLPQGSELVYDLDSDRLTRSQYWTLPEPYDGRPYREEALLDELEHLMLDSVRLRLIADVPVGIMLSGGLDSSLVTAMAARVSSKPVRTFNISFPGHGKFNEGPFAKLVADHFGTDHVELAAEPATVDLLPELARQFDEPLADSSMVPTYLVSRLIRRDATVAIGGDGGDELFGGYFHYNWVRKQDLMRRFIPSSLRRLASSLGRALPLGVRGRNYLVSAAHDVDWSIAHANLFFDLPARRRLLASMGHDIDDAPEREKTALAWGNTAVQRAMAADFRAYMVDDILVKVDRASMLTSLEVRAPLLDPRIIEFAFGRVPDELRAWKGQRKVLLRKLAKRVLPPQLDITRKHGFSIPLREWFKGDWGRYMRDVIAQSDLFDQSAVGSLMRWQERGLVNTHRIFALAMFELWRREYGVSV